MANYILQQRLDYLKNLKSKQYTLKKADRMDIKDLDNRINRIHLWILQLGLKETNGEVLGVNSAVRKTTRAFQKLSKAFTYGKKTKR